MSDRRYDVIVAGGGTAGAAAALALAQRDFKVAMIDPGKRQQFNQESARHRSSSMAPPVQIEGVIFNSIKANLNITSAMMRIQVRMNQLKGKGVVSNAVRIFKSQVRDAVIVPRSVTLGLPVCLIGTKEQGTGNTVQDDYRAVAQEIIDNEASVTARKESYVASGLSPIF